MKKNITRAPKAQRYLLIALFITCMVSLKAGEFVLMNRIISWDVNAQDAFWSIMPDASMPANWSSPDDYYNGLIYSRYEIISVATDIPCGMQFGLFQWKGAHQDSCGELCERAQMLAGAGYVAYNVSSPTTWWRAHGGVDFSKIGDFQSMGPVIYSWDTKYPVGKPGQGGDPAGVSWSQRFNWFPITLRVTVVAVSHGSTFSGWDKYIINPALRQPTPTYGIDFINETTDKVVPVTDQFSIYSGMSHAIDGTGQKMPITPGQDANFRTKAGSGLLVSEIQHFRAPVRPATPTFVLDKVNHRTTTVVTSDYEYSTHADMSSAVTGSGTYVSIPVGTTMYFRKKATASSFKSNVQLLSESTKLPIAHELLLFNDTIDFPNSTDSNGFYYFYYNADMPVNWLTPDDYYYGEVFARFEIISQKTETPIGLQFGIWQMLPPETGELHETMSKIAGMNGTGSVVIINGSPSTWWRLDPYLDYTKMNLTWHFGINPWKLNPYSEQIRQENKGAWAERFTYWFPMKVAVTIIAVAADYNFSGWNNYINTNPGVKKSRPDIGIDYLNGLTDKVIPSTIEYSAKANMSDAVNGTGAKLTLTPGQDMYFRTRAGDGLYASDIQHLVVPARPAGPTINIDWDNEQTDQNISSDMDYSSSESFSSISTGTGSKITIIPGQDLYFRKKASATAFGSEVYHLVTPSRPAGPVVTINYLNERTNEVLPPAVEYSQNASMAGATSGSNATLSLTPGNKVYFRSKSTSSAFKSLVSELNVPGRPSAPTFTIDFAAEKTSQSVSANVQYADNVNMTGALSGSNAQLTVIPGSNLFFRNKATSSDFCSSVQTLEVPARPQNPAFTINYAATTTVETAGTNIIYSSSSNLSNPQVGTGVPIVLEPGQDLYLKQIASSSSFSSGISHLAVPAANFLGYSGSSTITEKKLLLYAILIDGSSAFTLDDLQVTNGTAQNLKTGNIFEVIPAAEGNVSVVIPANTTKPNSFASNTVTVFYDDQSTALEDLNKDVPRIYPNPSSGRRITLQIPSADADQLDVYTIDGTFVKGISLNHSEYQTIDLQELHEGIYLLKIRTTGGMSIQKVVLE